MLSYFNVAGATEVCESGNSFANRDEAAFVVLLVEALICDDVTASNVGVITLYKAQHELILRLLSQSTFVNNSILLMRLFFQTCQAVFVTRSVLKHDDVRAVQVSTIDAFQGGEKGVIVLSCVRTTSTAFMDNDKCVTIPLNCLLMCSITCTLYFFCQTNERGSK